jgi:cation diffusion facilitator CzcD-associated flavoprotein CzcO
MLDHVGYMPKEKCARGPELLEHAQRLAIALGLYEKALFKTEILSIHWQQDSAIYSIKTNHNDKINARFVIGVAGSLHRPKLPGFPGIETFKGHSFHSSRWDYKYTGGDSSGGLVNLADKRVAIIGTGATAVQIVPNLAQWCKKLYVFQRTPSSIDIRNNRPTDPKWAETLSGKWQQARMDNFNTIVCGGHQEVDLVNDGWTDIIRNLYPSSAGAQPMSKEEAAKRRQLLDFQKMEQIRKRVDAIVSDPVTAEALKPYYNQFCKRPCFHDEYLSAFNHPNVQLIDTKGQGIERITETCVVANGEEFEIDCLIYATGFERATSWSHRAGMEVYGRDGKALGDKFLDGPSTFQGWVSKDFPNFFMVTTLQAFVTANFLHTTAIQADHMAYVVAECKKRNIRTIEPTQEAEDEWVETIIKSGVNSRAFHMECTPGYYNNEGQITQKLAKNQWYGGSSLWVINMLRKWREAGKLEGLATTLIPSKAAPNL